MVVENRRYVRFARQLDVEVLTYARELPVDIEGLRTYTTNVSFEGLQIECPGMRMVGFESAVKNEKLKLRIKIPNGKPVHAVAQVRYRSPYGDDYLIGLYLAAFDKDDAPDWKRYIESLRGSRSIS